MAYLKWVNNGEHKIGYDMVTARLCLLLLVLARGCGGSTNCKYINSHISISAVAWFDFTKFGKMLKKFVPQKQSTSYGKSHNKIVSGNLWSPFVHECSNSK